MPVGIFWTVAPCFPFSHECSVLSVYCIQQYTMENAVLPWLKEQLPWFGECVDMSGRPHAVRFAQCLQRLWKHLESHFRYCFPQTSQCQKERRGASLAQRWDKGPLASLSQQQPHTCRHCLGSLFRYQELQIRQRDWHHFIPSKIRELEINYRGCCTSECCLPLWISLRCCTVLLALC